MRNDLRRACGHCALRLPEASATCPRCRWATTTPDTALKSFEGAKQSLELDRPVRDALIYVPAGLLYVAGVVVALFAAVAAAIDVGAQGGGLLVILLVLLVPAAFTTTVFALAVPWGVWAAIVALVSWILGRRKLRQLLQPAPFAVVLTELPGRTDWLERAKQWLRPHWMRKTAIALGSIFAVELVAELLTGNPFGGEDAAGALQVAGSMVLLQLVVLVVLAIPFSMVLQGFVGLQAKLARLAHVLRERRRDRPLTDPVAGTASLRSGRTAVRGAARAVGSTNCVAPLSGRPCLGFRLVGRAGLALVDDADLGELLVQTAEDEVVVRGARAVLALADPGETVRDPTVQQRERVAAFLARRGLPAAHDLALGETLLCEGDEVVAHGTPSAEPFAGSDYRTATTRRVLDDADGLPILVERPPSR